MRAGGPVGAGVTIRSSGMVGSAGQFTSYMLALTKSILTVLLENKRINVGSAPEIYR